MEQQIARELAYCPQRITLELMPPDATPPAPGLYLVRERVEGYEPRWALVRWDEQWLIGGYVRLLGWAGPLPA